MNSKHFLFLNFGKNISLKKLLEIIFFHINACLALFQELSNVSGVKNSQNISFYHT